MAVTNDPQPEFDGECAFAVSTGKFGVAGSPDHRVADGAKAYYFKNGAARLLWKVLPNRDTKAHRVWAEHERVGRSDHVEDTK